MQKIRCISLASMLVAGLLFATVPMGVAAEQGLSITSNIKLGSPFFGDTIGPFSVGDDLTLVCSGDAIPGRSLSWWEDKEQLKASPGVSGHLIFSSLELGPLKTTFTGRRFICRDDDSNLEKLVILQVRADQDSLDPSLGETNLDSSPSDGALDSNSEADRVQNNMVMVEIEASTNEQATVRVIQKLEGDSININCIHQDYNPSSLSWWEGETLLKAPASHSQYASSSLLTLDALSTEDTGRLLTCRGEGTAWSSTVRLEVYGADEATTHNIQPERPVLGAPIGTFQVRSNHSLACTINDCGKVNSPSKEQFTSHASAESSMWLHQLSE